MSTGLLYCLYGESGSSAHLWHQLTSAEVSILQESATSAEYKLHKNFGVGWDYQSHKPPLTNGWKKELAKEFSTSKLPDNSQERAIYLMGDDSCLSDHKHNEAITYFMANHNLARAYASLKTSHRHTSFSQHNLKKIHKCHKTMSCGFAWLELVVLGVEPRSACWLQWGCD